MYTVNITTHPVEGEVIHTEGTEVHPLLSYAHAEIDEITRAADTPIRSGGGRVAWLAPDQTVFVAEVVRYGA